MAKDEDRVERRSQFVRHVGQKVGLVLRGERQFRRFFFKCKTGLFDFLVFAFDFGVLFRKLLRFLRQLFVGLLQLALPRLQLCRKLLRLREQTFSLHRGFDRVEHDPDRCGELLKKGDVRCGEVAKGGEFDNRFHFVFEEDGQHDHTARHRAKKPRVDLRCVYRQIVDDHTTLFCHALAE